MNLVGHDHEGMQNENTILAMTGSCFWQEESYGHLVRNEREFEKIRSCIEENPVRAGWVTRGVTRGPGGSAPPPPGGCNTRLPAEIDDPA